MVRVRLPVEVLVLLLPPGMIGVISGAHDDGYGGLLGWMWVVCAITTGILFWVTWLALRERFYSAVMAATGPALPRDPHRVRHRPRRSRGLRPSPQSPSGS